MKLYDVLSKRGYTFRQHLEEEGWGLRKPTVVDLDDEQSEALEQGGVAALKEALEQQNKWTFPALDIQKPLPRRGDTILAEGGRPACFVVAPEGNDALHSLAKAVVDAIEERHGVRLPTLPEDKATPDLLDTRSLMVFGGAHENRLALELALRCHLFFLDATVPGEDGWAVTVHSGLNSSGKNVAQIAASASNGDAAVKRVLDAVAAGGDRVILRHTHCVHHGARMAERFPSWGDFAASLPKGMRQAEGRTVEDPDDIEAVADLLALGLDSGGFDRNWGNTRPIDVAILCAHYYQLSADRRALDLFRALLFRLADYYLKMPGGASYPNDLDFRLGHLILSYARLEHDSVFTDEDRLILANLLLSCTRSIYEYTMKQWALEPDGRTRHNHETFPGRSLLYASNYFRRYGLAEANDWRAWSDRIYSGGLWRRGKQRENAYAYELYAYEHGMAYSSFRGHGLNMFADGCLGQAVARQMATTDNFLRPTDYGDSRPSMDPPDRGLAKLVATKENGPVRWFAWECFARKPEYAVSPVRAFPGVSLGPCGSPPVTGVWEHVPLEMMFIEDNATGFPHDLAFDKLAFRTGWEDDDHYLLFEGVGNARISHAHNDPNDIVRINHLGRHWVVSNGYGKRTNVTHALKAFGTRVRGPEDHNMLVLQRDGDVFRDPPPCSALLQRGGEGGVLYATGALPGYGGVDWLRTLVVLTGGYILALDRVRVTEPGVEKAHVEWNCLGDATPTANGFRLDQKGVFMDICSPSGWRAELGVADQSEDWKQLLESGHPHTSSPGVGAGVLEHGQYPYASFPITKLTFHVPGTEVGQSYCLATLLAATRGEPAYAVSQGADGSIVVEGPHGSGAGVGIEDGDLSIQVADKRCEVRFDASPSIPATLRDWATLRTEGLAKEARG